MIKLNDVPKFKPVCPSNEMAPHAIDLRELDRDLGNTKSLVDAWAKQRTDFATHTKDSHAESVQDQSGERGGGTCGMGPMHDALDSTLQRSSRAFRTVKFLSAPRRSK